MAIWRWPAVFGLALTGGLTVTLVSRSVPFFGWMLAYAGGQALGGWLLAAAGQRRAPAVWIVSLVGLLTGAFLTHPLAAVATAQMAGTMGDRLAVGFSQSVLLAGALDIWNWVTAAFLCLGAAMRLR